MSFYVETDFVTHKGSQRGFFRSLLQGESPVSRVFCSLEPLTQKFFIGTDYISLTLS